MRTGGRPRHTHMIFRAYVFAKTRYRLFCAVATDCSGRGGARYLLSHVCFRVRPCPGGLDRGGDRPVAETLYF